MSEEQPPSLWRTVRANPPTEDDFLSFKALGRPRRGGSIEQWEGVSTFDNPDLATDMARQFKQGEYLARLELDPSGPIRWAKTRGPGHYTIWGTPAELLACVAEVVPLDTAEGKAR